MNTTASYSQRLRKRLYIALTLFILYLVIIFSYGYRIPHGDRHPDWPQFTIIENGMRKEIYDTKGGIRIEFFLDAYDKIEFLDSIGFDTKQLDLPDSLCQFYAFKPNFLKADSDAIVSNEFELGNTWKFNMSSTGGPFLSDEKDKYVTRFDHVYFQYFEISIGAKKGYFKIDNNDFHDPYFKRLYQCNNVRTEKDTLYFVFSNSLYRAYVFNKENK